MKNYLMYSFLFALIISCGKSESKKNEDSSSSSPYITSTYDSDGDGINDDVEIKNGTDPFIADIPKFTGDFFNEFSVNIEFYKKSTLNYQMVGWSLKDNKLKFSWSENLYKVPAGSVYLDTLLKNYALNTNFRENNFFFADYNEGVFSHSSPIYQEETIYEISKRILNFEREGFELNRAEVVGLMKLNVSSTSYQYFRNPVFDLYYKARDREELVFIESKRIEGTYKFNTESSIYLKFDSSNKKLAYDALINGGGSFFVKVRDFYVYDSNEWYSEIIQRVKSKSIPVSVSINKEGKQEFDTIYVGTNGGEAGVKSLLSKAFKNQVLFVNNSLEQLGSLRTETSTYEFGKNETYRWYVGTNGGTGNVFTNLYNIGDGIVVSYLSDKRLEKRPIYTQRSPLSSDNTSFRSNLMPSNTKGIKIRFTPQVYKIPKLEYFQFKRNECGRGSWYRNESIYESSKLIWKDKLKEFSMDDMDQIYMTVSDGGKKLLSGKLLDLIRNDYLFIEGAIGREFFDLTVAGSVLSGLSSQSSLSVQISITPYKHLLNPGVTKLISKRCDAASHPEPTRSLDKSMGLKSLDHLQSISASSGIEAEESFSNEFSIDTHIFSY